MISRTHCLVYEQRWGPHCAHVWHWIAFFVCCVFTSRCSAVECFFYEPVVSPCLCNFYKSSASNTGGMLSWSLLGSFCNDDLSEKSRIILHRVIWLLGCGTLLFCVKLNTFGFRHMELESLLRITLKEPLWHLSLTAGLWVKGFCWETKKLHLSWVDQSFETSSSSSFSLYLQGLF